MRILEQDNNTDLFWYLIADNRDNPLRQNVVTRAITERLAETDLEAFIKEVATNLFEEKKANRFLEAFQAQLSDDSVLSLTVFEPENYLDELEFGQLFSDHHEGLLDDCIKETYKMDTNSAWKKLRVSTQSGRIYSEQKEVMFPELMHLISIALEINGALPINCRRLNALVKRGALKLLEDTITGDVTKLVVDTPPWMKYIEKDLAKERMPAEQGPLLILIRKLLAITEIDGFFKQQILEPASIRLLDPIVTDSEIDEIRSALATEIF